MRYVRLLLVFVFFLSIDAEGQRASTQKPAPPPPIYKPRPQVPAVQEIDPNDVVKVDTAEVLLPVTIRDRNGKLVEGLTRKDFRIFEEDVPQQLSELSLRQVAVDIVLMVDTSSSVTSNLDDFRSAADGFARALDVEDRVSLVQFDDRVQLLQDWTRSRVQFRRSLARVAPGMFTRFNDAIVLTSNEQFQQSSSRRAIIILTDGIDSGRGTSFDVALRAALGAQAAVYVISNIEIERNNKQGQVANIISGGDASVRFNQIQIEDLRMGLAALDSSEKKLEDLTRSTGGRLYLPRSFNDLGQTYAEVASELRHQYALYYAPGNRSRDGRFRRVRVETTNPDYTVSARAGYFAPKR